MKKVFIGLAVIAVIDAAAGAGVDQLTDERREKGKAALEEKAGDTLKCLF